MAETPGRRVIGRSDGVGTAVDQSGASSGASSAPRIWSGRSTASSRSRQSAPQGASAVATSGGERRRRRRPRARTVLAVGLVGIVLVPIALIALGWRTYSNIPKVDVSASLSPRAGRVGSNYLVVGTDSRAGISVNDPNSGAFLGETVTGARTDTIMVMHIEGSAVQLVSIPRDLWVSDPSTGTKGRINSTFAAGPGNLIRAVEALGVPVDHYLEIDFVSFAKLVDAVGGITIVFPAPARDDHSGLLITKAGPNHLDGAQALAYVRSRYYQELVGGTYRTDGTADIGRTERQRGFLTALLHAITTERNPLALIELSRSVGPGLRIDSTLSHLDAVGLAWTLKDMHPTTAALPVTPRVTSGGADVLELQSEASVTISALAR